MPDQTPHWELDTRHLLALASIARNRSVSRAAAELGYGQSAVSQQLAALERIVGHRLVDRGTGPRPVTLTPAGEALLPHAEWVLARLAVARRELDHLDNGDAGIVRIGTFQSAGSRLLPGILSAFRRRWPGITISIHNEVHDGELPALVRSGALDVAFVELTSIGPGLGHLALLDDRYLALVPPGHRFAERTSVSLSEFAGEDLVDGLAGDTCSVRSERALRAAGVDPQVVFRTEDNPTRQRLVDAGLGCAVLPELTVERGLPNGAVIVPLVEDLHRTITLAWASERTMSAAVRRFLDVAREAGGPDAQQDPDTRGRRPGARRGTTSK